MLTKEEALRASNLSWEQMQQEYPKAAMVIEYITKHYPDDKDAISRHRMLPQLIFGEHSNSEIEQMIDKLAIFNGWKKYEAIQSQEEEKE